MCEEEIVDGLRNAIVNYDEESVKRLANKVIEKEIDPLKAIQDGLVKGINEVGEKFGAKEITKYLQVTFLQEPWGRNLEQRPH